MVVRGLTDHNLYLVGLMGKTDAQLKDYLNLKLADFYVHGNPPRF